MNSKLNCLVIEDEPLAAEILCDYINEVPFLHLAGTCADVFVAMEKLKRKAIDVLFLDIHLPKVTGLDFLRTLASPPQVIIVSAYHQYAVDGYELNVTDYLLKPVEFSRFLAAVNKLRLPAAQATQGSDKKRIHHFFHSGKENIRVFEDEIIYAESLGEYIKIHTADKTLMVRQALSSLEEQLSKGEFIRIHRSYLVARSKILSFTYGVVTLHGMKLPIGRNYKEQTLTLLRSRD